MSNTPNTSITRSDLTDSLEENLWLDDPVLSNAEPEDDLSAIMSVDPSLASPSESVCAPKDRYTQSAVPFSSTSKPIPQAPQSPEEPDSFAVWWKETPWYHKLWQVPVGIALSPFAVTPSCTTTTVSGNFITWYRDEDGDGFGRNDDTLTADEDSDPEGYVKKSGDCDDGEDTINPDADEICDELDNDCDGLVDENALDAEIWYADSDEDGFGDIDNTELACQPPQGYTEDHNDCNDADPTIYLDAPEICDDVDNDCNDIVDDNPVNGNTWYPDTDEDGHGISTGAIITCDEVLSGYAALSDDCDDGDSEIHPYAEEICDGMDNNCDGVIDKEEGFICLSTVGTTTSGIKYLGEGYGNVFGSSLSLAGDVDDDGYSDILLGAKGYNGNEMGRVYLVYGGPFASGIVNISSSADAIFDGEASGYKAGSALATAGDTNGDGIDDFMIGSSFYVLSDPDDDSPRAGAIYLLRGNTDRFTGSMDLGSVADLKLTGEIISEVYQAYHPGAGATLVNAGDMDGVMGDEIFIGAPNFYGSGSRSGGAYLASGIGTGEVSLASAQAKLIGKATNDSAGDALTAGDFNGDGTPDLVVGAWGNDDGGANAGATYLFYGPVTGALNVDNADLTFLGDDSYYVGGYALTAGHADEDTYTDLLVTAYGVNNAYLFNGANMAHLPDTVDVSTYPVDATFIGNSGEADFRSVAFAGDIDGDGNQDMIVGGSGNDEGGENAGAAYLIYGPFPDLINLNDIGGLIRGVKFIGEYSQQDAGSSVAGAGDVNGDGYDDLLIGADYDSTNGVGAGAAYLIPGGPSI